MNQEELLQKVKESIRVGNSSIDGDTTDYILACKADLKRVGLKNIDCEDPLILQAIKLYVKWHVDFEGEAERYRLSYEALRDSLSMCGDYNV